MIESPNHLNQRRSSILLWFGVTLLFVLADSPLRAERVAIFDFDDRLEEENTVAHYIEKRLKNADPRIDVRQHSGKGNEARSIEVLRNLDGAGYDLIITITTDALILARHILTRTPVLYTNVNNPLSLGFESLEAPGGNISGASYYVPIEKQLALYQKIQPQMRTIGLIFDRYNKSRKVELPEARNACSRLGIRPEIEIMEKNADLVPLIRRLLDAGVDAVIATSSDKVYNHIGEFVGICTNAGVPVYSFNKGGVNLGAVAALASDYFEMVDRLLIPMAIRVLHDNVNPGSLPPAFLQQNRVYLNARQIEKLRLQVPPDIFQNAVWLNNRME